MDASKQRAVRNSAKVEFLACAEEAVSMLGKGFNKFNVYSELSKKGLLTMAYRSFCWHLQQFKNIKREKKKVEQPVTVPTHRVSAKKESFGQIEDVDTTSLI